MFTKIGPGHEDWHKDFRTSPFPDQPSPGLNLKTVYIGSKFAARERNDE